MRLIRKIIAIARFLKKIREHILPNLENLNHEIILLKKDMGKLRENTAALQQDREEMHDSIVRMEEKYKNFDRVIVLQNQLLKILLDKEERQK
jgi:septal ring factor EnvC (AmiA/AmiB activator)